MRECMLGKEGLKVSALGLGCMGMTPIYGTPDPQEAVRTIHAAIDAGMTLIDSADAYADGKNEELVGRALAGKRDRVALATKFGNIRYPDGTRSVNGRPEYVAEACEASLKRLAVDSIDLYFLHRIDSSVPIEDTVGAMAKLVEAGKVRYLGLSEAGARTIERAHATHPISALQTEYSLASRDVEAEILPTCRKLGIGFVAYSPLSRGLLTGRYKAQSDLGGNDRRNDMPRFKSGNIDRNVALLGPAAEIAERHGCSQAAVALAWLLAQGDDIVPIPGCSRRETLKDALSALELKLSAQDVQHLSDAIPVGAMLGTRYPEKQMARLGI